MPRAADLLIAALGAARPLAVLLAAAVLLKLDCRGPVIYRQIRVGLHGGLSSCSSCGR